MRMRAVAAHSMILLAQAWAFAQVPIDLSRAKEFRLTQRFDLGGQISSIAYNEAFCGNSDLNVITTGVSGRGRVTWRTTPNIDTTNLFDWNGIRSPYILVPLDYDGIAPLDYVNANGIIWRCSRGQSPFPLMPIDTVANGVCSNAPVSSADVDGDGYLDVITEIGRDGVTTRVILGGPTAGKGCERMLLVPVVKSGNKYNITKAFYKSAVGDWRLIQQERDSLDRAPRLQMYRVTFTRTETKPDVTFTPLGRYQGEDVSQIDEPYGEICVVVDSINGTDHMLMDHRIGPPGSQWALERFDVTTGQIVSSGEVVKGFNFFHETYWDLQYGLGTQRSVILISSDKGGLFSFIDDLQHPFALFNPSGTGAQPVSGLTTVNDQTGDGSPDLVFVGGNGVMLVLSLDSVNTSMQAEEGNPIDSVVRILGSTLEVVSTTGGLLFITVAALDGRLLRSLPPIAVAAGVTSIDLEPHLSPLARGPYFLRVSVNDQVNTIMILK